MMLPRAHGPVSAIPGRYYYTAIMQKLSSQPVSLAPQDITLLPNALFEVMAIEQHRSKTWARGLSDPHEVEFFLQVSGSSRMVAGYHPVKSPLVLLAMQGE